MHECSPKHLRVGTATMKSDNTEEEGKRRVNKERSTEGKEKKSQWPGWSSGLTFPRGRSSRKQWINYMSLKRINKQNFVYGFNIHNSSRRHRYK